MARGMGELLTGREFSGSRETQHPCPIKTPILSPCGPRDLMICPGQMPQAQQLPQVQQDPGTQTDACLLVAPRPPRQRSRAGPRC